jgi:hypothetical protein
MIIVHIKVLMKTLNTITAVQCERSEISFSQGGEIEDGCLLGCATMPSGRSFTTLRRFYKGS